VPAAAAALLPLLAPPALPNIDWNMRLNGLLLEASLAGGGAGTAAGLVSSCCKNDSCKMVANRAPGLLLTNSCARLTCWPVPANLQARLLRAKR
jgi:hypothetical protein